MHYYPVAVNGNLGKLSIISSFYIIITDDWIVANVVSIKIGLNLFSPRISGWREGLKARTACVTRAAGGKRYFNRVGRGIIFQKIVQQVANPPSLRL
jgi:hypothetical protein